MARTKFKEYLTLTKRLVTLAVLVLAGFLLYRWIRPLVSPEDEFTIDDTPLRVEQVRAIVELNTLNFRDEVVVDSVEYYRNAAERLVGTSEKMQSDFVLDLSPIRRRLTMIVRGDLLYGVDLKKKEMKVSSTDSTLTILLPQPTLLTVSVSPENTEIFVENGTWQDYERQQLQAKAKGKMIASGERLKLVEKAKYPLEKLLQKLVKTEKKLEIRYY
jgi:hypothetical protein